MKTKISISTLDNIILILFTCGCLFISCNNTNTTEPVIIKDKFDGISFTTIEIDSREYIYLNDWFAHKGNCKCCKERSLNKK